LRFVSLLLSALALAHAGVYFEPNRGQAPASVRFLARGAGETAALTAQRARLLRRDGSLVSVEFAGARDVLAEGEAALGGVSHYAFGRDPKRWLRGVPHYARVRFPGALPGIDLVYHASDSDVEFNFELAPHAYPSLIALRFDEPVTLLPSGALRYGAGELKQPRAWQTIGGKQVAVEAGFAMDGRQAVHFALGQFDPALPLTIDPVLVFATYLGGSSTEGNARVVAGPDGSVYVAGNTMSADFPLTATSTDGLNRPVTMLEPDVYVAKMKADGSALEWSLFFGGSGDEEVSGLAQDSLGNIFLLGTTTSYDLPVTASAMVSQFSSGPLDGFVVKLDQQSGDILASTYLGLNLSTNASFCGSVDTAGGVYIGGASPSISPTIGAFQTINSNAGSEESTSFLMRIKPALNTLVYATWFNLGSTCPMAVDAAGNVVVAGIGTLTSVAPLHPIAGVDQGTSWNGRAYVAKLNSSGSALLFASALDGGTATTYGWSQIDDVTIDAAGNIDVIGLTKGTLPQVNPLNVGTLPSTYPALTSDMQTAFLAEIPAAGGKLLQSTLLYGPDYTANATARLVPGASPLCIAGMGAARMQQTAGGLGADYVAYTTPSWGWTLECVDDANTSISLKTALPYTGGSFTDLAAAPDGTIIFAGTAAMGLQTTPGVLQPDYAAGSGFAMEYDAFLMRVSLKNPAPQIQTVYPSSIILDTSQTATPSFDLYGTGFASGAVVELNGKAVASTYSGSGHITLSSMAPTAIQLGANQIAVSLPAPGGGISAPVTVTGINASPMAVSVTPASVAAGAAETKIVVRATNLTPGSTLTWNGQVRRASYVADPSPATTGHFELLLEPAELAAAGVVPVTVTVPGPGGGVSPVANFIVQGAPVPSAPVLYTSSSSYWLFTDMAAAGPIYFYGLNLAYGLQAYWDGAPITSTFAAGAVTLQPPAADLAHIGVHSVYVIVGGLTSNTVLVRIGYQLASAAAAADPAGQRLYVLTNSSTMLNTTTSDLYVFDMNTNGVVNHLVGVNQQAGAIAVSADGAYVYMADEATPVTIRRYNASSGKIDLSWPVPKPSAEPGLTIMSIATPTDSPETLVVMFYYAAAYSTAAPMIRIFDGPHPRAHSSPNVNPTLVQGPMFVSSDQIFITEGVGLHCVEWLNYGATGIGGGQTSCVDLPPGTIDDHGLIYLTDGTRIMPLAFPFTSANSQYAPSLAADLAHRRAFWVAPGSGGTALTQYDLDTQQQSMIAPLSAYGTYGLFVTPSGKLLVLGNNALVPFQ
jgi:hypothetical protein